jgi:uncharacterized protein (DUF1778 family)
MAVYVQVTYSSGMSAKTDRKNFRLSPEQSDLIERAAATEGVSLSDFTISAAVSHARNVLADRRLFVLADAEWAEFQNILNRPVEAKPRLSKLFDEPSIFE